MVGQSFSSVAGIILIVAAGGGFKQTLVDSGIGDVIANSITESAMNPLIAGWLVAVLIRLATGSATVATVHRYAGIMVPPRHRHDADASGDAGARHRRRFRILLAPE